MTLEERIKETLIIVPDFPKPGVAYKDITPLFQSPALCHDVLDALAAHYAQRQIEAIIGLESRGFMFGFALAMRLNIPFVLIRKKGKLPRPTYSVSYELEYGESIMEMHRDALRPGQRVLIHDDLLATGGTAHAAAELIRKAEASVAGFSFIIELSYLEGRERLKNYSPEISTFVTY